jgi:hypothetical protein
VKSHLERQQNKQEGACVRVVEEYEKVEQVMVTGLHGAIPIWWSQLVFVMHDLTTCQFQAAVLRTEVDICRTDQQA